jgi:hypothetical protein
MLNAQAAAIADALISAGIAPDAAGRIAKILGNPEQALYHAGPQKVDVTPRAMRKITPDVRKHQLQNVDFREADPDYKQPIHRTTEEAQVPVPPDSVRETELSSAAKSAAFRVAAGQYVSADSAGDSVKIGLRVAGNGRAVMLDPPSSTLIGKTLRAEADANDTDRLRFYIDETGQEIVWKMQLQNVERCPVVTGVKFNRNKGLELTCRNAYVWTEGDPFEDIIPTRNVGLVNNLRVETDQIDGKASVVAEKASIPAFAIDGLSPDTFVLSSAKLCKTGEGGWDIDTTADLAVFDSDGIGGEAATGEVVPQCVNRVEYVPPYKYVIVAQMPSGKWQLVARQRDWCKFVPPDNLPGLAGTELASTGFSPDHTAGDVEVGATGNPTALVLEQGCARWVTTQLAQVVTGLSFDGTQLVVTYTPSYVLKSLTPTEPVAIPFGVVESVLTGVTLTPSGLEFTKKDVTVISSASAGGTTIGTESCDSGE